MQSPTPPILSPTLSSPQLTALSRDALLEQLDVVLKRLEPLSQPLPKVLAEKALWFNRSEFDQVNTLWKQDGIDAVVSNYGDTRTFASGMPVSLDKAPKGSVVLLLSEFGPNPRPDPAQRDYFRSSHIPLSEGVLSALLQSLEQSGLLSRLLPKVDDQTNAILEGAPIIEASCSSEWYGRDNYYGDGSTMAISLTLSPAGHEPEQLILTIDRSGEVRRTLWCERFFETGYEGHAHASSSLTQDELRAIIPIVAQVAELPPQKRQAFRVGMWLGNSLP